MGTTTLMLLGYILIFILIVLIISLILRIRNIEKKLINFSPTEAYAIMQTMRDMVIESERVADKLDSAIKDREAVLEDLSYLTDEKIARLDGIIDKNTEEKDKKSMVLALHREGLDEAEIARRLGISVTEVRIAVNLSAGKR